MAFQKTHTQFHSHTYHRYTLLGKHIDATEHCKTRQQENEENRIRDTWWPREGSWEGGQSATHSLLLPSCLLFWLLSLRKINVIKNNRIQLLEVKLASTLHKNIL